MSTERDKAQAFVASVERLVEAGYARAMSLIDEVKNHIDTLDAEREGSNGTKPTAQQMLDDIANEAEAKRGKSSSAWRRINPEAYTEPYAYDALYRRWQMVAPQFRNGGNVKGEHKAPSADLLNNLNKFRRDLGL